MESDDDMKGLGDLVDRFTQATGIKAVTKAIFGEDCGCDDRRQLLNERFPFAGGDAPHMTEADRNLWELTLSDWRSWNVIHPDVQREALAIWNRSARPRKRFSRCSSCVKRLFEDLEFLHQNSCDEDDTEAH